MKISLFLLFLLFLLLFLLFLLSINLKKNEKQKYPLALIHYALYNYMNDFHEICEKNQLLYWADSGTLLGAVRDFGIIPHDDDIDICMFESDVEKLIKIVNNNKDSKYYIYLLDYQPIYKFEHKKIPGIFIDIFVIDRDETDNKKIYYKEEKNRKVWPNFYYYENELYPMKKMWFGNIQIYTPNLPVPFLERAYGKNWKTPIDYGRH